MEPPHDEARCRVPRLPRDPSNRNQDRWEEQAVAACKKQVSFSQKLCSFHEAPPQPQAPRRCDLWWSELELSPHRRRSRNQQQQQQQHNKSQLTEEEEDDCQHIWSPKSSLEFLPTTTASAALSPPLPKEALHHRPAALFPLLRCHKANTKSSSTTLAPSTSRFLPPGFVPFHPSRSLEKRHEEDDNDLAWLRQCLDIVTRGEEDHQDNDNALPLIPTAFIATTRDPAARTTRST